MAFSVLNFFVGTLTHIFMLAQTAYVVCAIHMTWNVNYSNKHFHSYAPVTIRDALGKQILITQTLHYVTYTSERAYASLLEVSVYIPS
jgi:hypothetical protein